MRVVYAERARRDISEIFDSIAKHSSVSARRVEAAISAIAKEVTSDGSACLDRIQGHLLGQRTENRKDRGLKDRR